MDLLELHTFVAGLAIETGVFLLEQAKLRRKEGQNESRIKASAVDIVTSTDEEAEERIRTAIEGRFPDHQIIGEESYERDNKANRKYLVGDGPYWIVDPIDGTVNFVHLYCNWCISIAFCLKGRPVLGVILAPALSGPLPNATMTLFSGVQGHGSFATAISPTLPSPALTWPPTEHSIKLPYSLAPFPPDAPKGCVLAVEWGKQRTTGPGSNLTRKVESFVNLAKSDAESGGMVHGVRSLGSATLDMAYCATGTIDIFWEGGCWEWDVAAGIIILSEAGGITFSANAPESNESLEEAHLGSRLYLALRPCSGTPDETPRQAQERVAKEVYKRVQRLEYSRPMQ